MTWTIGHEEQPTRLSGDISFGLGGYAATTVRRRVDDFVLHAFPRLPIGVRNASFLQTCRLMLKVIMSKDLYQILDIVVNFLWPYVVSVTSAFNFPIGLNSASESFHPERLSIASYLHKPT
jgi:hypothetical protein